MEDRNLFEPNDARTKPMLKGTSISVDMVLEKLAEGYSTAEIVQFFPELSEEKVRACLRFGSELIEEAYTVRMKTAMILANKIRKLKGKPIVLKDADGKTIELDENSPL